MTQKVFCTKCGAQNEGDSRYCISCGAELVLYDQEASAPPPPGAAVYPGHPDYDEEIVPHPNLPVAGDSLSKIIGKSFSLYFENIGIFFGAFWIMTLITVAVNFVFGLIPILGNLISFVTAPLLVGVLYVFIRAVRGQSADIGQMFTCLEKKYVPALLANFIRVIALGIPIVILIAVFFMDTFVSLTEVDKLDDGDFAEIIAFFGRLFLDLGILMLVISIFSLFFQFTEPLIAGSDTDFWTAITASVKFVWRHFWSILLLVILGGIIYIAGVLVLFVGLLFTAPITYIFIACYYEAHKDEFDLGQG